MKKIIFSLLSLLIFAKTFSQTTTSPAISKDYYLQKSKNQKTTAWVLLGAGIGMTVGGLAINQDQPLYGGSSNDNAKGLWLSYLGGATTLSSIPFFISGHKNKKRAASVTINNQRIFLSQQSSLCLTKQPAITLKINL